MQCSQGDAYVETILASTVHFLLRFTNSPPFTWNFDVLLRLVCSCSKPSLNEGLMYLYSTSEGCYIYLGLLHDDLSHVIALRMLLLAELLVLQGNSDLVDM